MLWSASKNVIYCTFWFLISINSVLGEGFDFELSGQVGAAGKYSKTSGTDLVPNPSAANYQNTIREGFGLAKVKLNYQNMTLRSQLRVEASNQREDKLLVDELYSELLLGDASFVYGGRRILSYGQSFGLNPADVFYNPLAVSSIYPSSQSRALSQGVGMVGADIGVTSSNTLTLIYVHDYNNPRIGSKERVPMLRYSGFLTNSMLDYTASLIGGERAGMGLSFSQGIGDASVLYMDATIRRGREKQVVSGTGAIGQLLTEKRKADGYFTFATLGFGHTFDSGLTANIELSHDAAGYSSHEWRQLVDALDTITPVQSATHGRALGQLNGMLNHFILRKNYAFLRLHKDKLFGESVSGEVTMLYGSDDGSGTSGLRLEAPVGESLTTGLYVTRRLGSKNDEFRLRPVTNSISIYMLMKF